MAPLRSASTLPAFSQVRIEAGARAVTVEREQAGALPALIARVGAAETGEPVAGTASLRIVLAEGARKLGVLERVEGAWRWTPDGADASARTLRPDAELSQALQREAQRLLDR